MGKHKNKKNRKNNNYSKTPTSLVPFIKSGTQNQRQNTSKFDRFIEDTPIAVYKNLFLGKLTDVSRMKAKGVNVLVPLDSLYGSVWDNEWHGEILYYPMPDFSVMPDDITSDLVARVITRLKNGQKVGIFCIGGRGRTGTIAAILLGKLGYEDPILYLRKHYNAEIIESHVQLRQVARLLDKPEILDKYKPCDIGIYRGFGNTGFYGGNFGYGTYADLEDYYTGYEKSHSHQLSPMTDFSPTEEGEEEDWSIFDQISQQCQSCVWNEGGDCATMGEFCAPGEDCCAFEDFNSYLTKEIEKGELKEKAKEKKKEETQSLSHNLWNTILKNH